MAGEFKRFVIDGYGQLELNNVAFRRDGRVEAQCALDATDFASVPAENGMLLAVDRINRVVKFPKSAVIANCPVALNYTAEHMYDERANALKDFKLERGTFLPRLGFLSAGELFTTNCVGYDDTEWTATGSGDTAKTADENFMAACAAVGTTPLYGGVSDEGAIAVSATKPSAGPVLKVVEATTMPDGTFGIKFQVLTA
jgi:hypothetical protein